MSGNNRVKSSEPVLDYLKNYSQNKNLPKYFSGSAVSYLPAIVSEDDEIICDKIVENEDCIKIPEELDETRSSTSSSESISYQKKLEWDNGADIGYNSIKSLNKLHKSLSLPVMDDLKSHSGSVPSTVITTQSTSEENIEIIVLSSSSSASTSSSASLKSATTPNNIDCKNNPSNNIEDVKLKSFQKTLNYLKQKIGVPEAHSTPNNEEPKKREPASSSKPESIICTPCSSKSSSSQAGSQIVEKNLKKVQLKPESASFSEIIARPQCEKKITTKVVELTISKPININCKSAEFKNMATQITNFRIPQAVQTDCVYLQNIETQCNIEPTTTSSDKRIGNNYCDEMAGDSASSFEYFHCKHKNTEQIEQKTKKKVSISPPSEENSVVSVTNKSAGDFDKYLKLLHKLLQTKKLNSSTKKKYIKSLLRELNGLEISDTPTTTSSELFIPKRSSGHLEAKSLVRIESGRTPSIIDKSKENSHVSTVYSDCNCSGSSSQEGKVSEFIQPSSSSNSQIVPQTKHAEENSHSLSSRRQSAETACKIKSILSRQRADGVVGEIKSNNNNNKSEDCLLEFAENERSYQLHWINNEILHLNKLKDVLQSTKSTKTHVYNVKQKDSTNHRYVIETDENISSNEPLNYYLEGKKYEVQTDSCKISSGSNNNNNNNNTENKAVFADILVESDDKQTNIKVRKICCVCKESNCVCTSQKTIPSKISSLCTDFDDASSLGAAAEICLKCQEIRCSCCCNKATISIEKNSSEETISAKDSNSLKKVLEKCRCTTLKGSNCNCNFVEKLYDKFKIPLCKCVDQAMQTDDDAVCSQKKEIGIENKPFTRNAGQESENFTSKNVALQTNMHEKNYKETQTECSVNNRAIQTSTKDFKTGSSQIEETKTCEEISGDNTITGKDKACNTEETKVFSKEAETVNQISSRKTQTEEKEIDKPAKKDSASSLSNSNPKRSAENHISEKMEQLEEEEEEDSNKSPEEELSVVPSTETTQSSSNNGASRIICFCCKQKAFLAEVNFLDESNNSTGVCSRCYYTAHPRYHQHQCGCRNYWHNFNQHHHYCTCNNNIIRNYVQQPKENAENVCLMYTVTLPPNNDPKKRIRSKDLKVRDGWNWKNEKNKENLRKKDVRKESQSSSKESDMNNGKKSSSADNGSSEIHYTLKEYLIKNKPAFISSAEYRRQMLLQTRISREQQKNDFKLHLADTLKQNNNNEASSNKYKLFTGREMKEINKKNYKKLPEVQKKLLSERDKRLKSADRLITNVFAKKVQKSILNGKPNFPIDRPLTSLP